MNILPAVLLFVALLFAAERMPKDDVKIFIDALHNHGVVYNADGTHLAVGRDGKGSRE